MTNILLLSVGTRNKVIQYFKKEFAGVGNVVVTDLTEIAPAIYEADKHYQVPRIIEDGYIDLILNICKKEQISGVLSLIDPELSLIAKNKERFAEIGVTIIGSSYDLCEMALDRCLHGLRSMGTIAPRAMWIRKRFIRIWMLGRSAFRYL